MSQMAQSSNEPQHAASGRSDDHLHTLRTSRQDLSPSTIEDRITWSIRYLQKLGVLSDQLTYAMFREQGIELGDGDRIPKHSLLPETQERFRKQLSSESADLARLAGISEAQHRRLCNQMPGSGFVMLYLCVLFGTNDLSRDLNTIKDEYSSRAQRIRDGSATADDHFHIRLFEINPITALLTYKAESSWADEHSYLNRAAAKEIPVEPPRFGSWCRSKDGQTEEPVIVSARGWYLDGLARVKEWDREIDRLERALSDRLQGSSNTGRIWGAFARELRTICTETTQLLSTLSLAVPLGGSDALIYFPRFPNSAETPLTVDEITCQLVPILPPAARVCTEYFGDRALRERCIHVPISISAEQASWFAGEMTRLTRAIREAVSKGGTLPVKEDEQVVPISVFFRERQDEHGQARISIKFLSEEYRATKNPTTKKRDANGFNFRIDFERNGSDLGGRPLYRATFDLGSTELASALKFATLVEGARSHLPPYPVRVVTEDSVGKNGNFIRTDGHSLESRALRPVTEQFRPGELISLMATTLASAGHLIGNRSALPVSHHYDEHTAVQLLTEAEVEALVRESRALFHPVSLAPSPQ